MPSSGSKPSRRAKNLDQHSKADAQDELQYQMRNKLGAQTLNFLSLPLDIHFYIFYMLNPSELCALLHTSKSICTTLLAPNASRIWTNARTRNLLCPGPDPPLGVSEMRWAAFMFKQDGYCKYCAGNAGEETRFPTLLRRICKICLPEQICYNVKELAPRVSGIQKLLPSMLHRSKGQRTRTNVVYLREDIIETAKNLLHLEEEYGKRSEKYKNFVKERTAVLRNLAQMPKIIERWNWELSRAAREENSRLCKLRCWQITERLIKLGFKEGDATKAILDAQLPQIPEPLLDIEFEQMQTSLVLLAKKAIALRMLEEHPTIVDARIHAVQMAVSVWKKTLQPYEWIGFPPFMQLSNHPSIQNCILSDVDDESRTFDVDTLLPLFPTIVAELTKPREDSFFQVLETMRKYRGIKNQQLINAEDWQQMTELLDEEIIEKAVCVMLHTVGEPLHGKDHALHCRVTTKRVAPDEEFMFPALTWYEDGFWTVARVMDAAGILKEERCQMTVQEMDKMDGRFVCVNCWKERVDSKTGKAKMEVFGWRGMVIHALPYSCPSRDNDAPTVRKLEGADYAKALQCDMYPDDREDQNIWGCLHCTDHCDAWESRSTVLHHLISKHSIADPVYNRDFMMASGYYAPNKATCQIVLPSEISNEL
ncbi:hypothetical protein DL96DRAFT_1595815 [Flagelloscypha sp. PMI_526]|nr:hypothetical protein DL96DRAFT_1595815 [Flagelloscypha sp. PMI_526]